MHDAQRTGIAAVWAFEIGEAKTAAEACTVADVLFISQIYNVQLELKMIFFLLQMLTTSSPNCSNTLVGCSAINCT